MARIRRTPRAGLRNTAAPPLVASELRHYLGLGPGWDGNPLTKPMKLAAFEDAMRFLDGRPERTASPVPGLHTSGDIAFVWESTRAFASITIEGGGKWSGYGYVKGKEGRQRESLWDDLPVTTRWPQDLVRIVRLAQEEGR